MAQANQIMQQQLKKAIADRAERQALGNTNVSLVDVASDICHELKDKTSVNHICNTTYLSRATVIRLLDKSETEHGQPYRPNADTVERVFTAAGYGLVFDPVVIKSRFLNKPKEEI